jgi:hypothetical protein
VDERSVINLHVVRATLVTSTLGGHIVNLNLKRKLEKERLKKVFALLIFFTLLPILVICIVSYALGRDLRLLFFIFSYFDYGTKSALIYGPKSINLLSWFILIVSVYLMYCSLTCKKNYKLYFFMGVILFFLVVVFGLGAMP